MGDHTATSTCPAPSYFLNSAKAFSNKQWAFCFLSRINCKEEEKEVWKESRRRFHIFQPFIASPGPCPSKSPRHSTAPPWLCITNHIYPPTRNETHPTKKKIQENPKKRKTPHPPTPAPEKTTNMHTQIGRAHV